MIDISRFRDINVGGRIAVHLDERGPFVAKPARNRFFASGEKVRVKKKTWLVDRKREHEGIPKGVKAQPIEEDVTHIEGEIAGPTYSSPTKGGEVYVPIRVGNGGVISVPENRLERVNQTPSREKNQEGPSGKSAFSKESIAFWRDYFRKEDALRELRKSKKRKGRA